LPAGSQVQAQSEFQSERSAEGGTAAEAQAQGQGQGRGQGRGHGQVRGHHQSALGKEPELTWRGAHNRINQSALSMRIIISCTPSYHAHHHTMRTIIMMLLLQLLHLSENKRELRTPNCTARFHVTLAKSFSRA